MAELGKILIVEDDEQNSRLIRKALEKQHACLSALTADEALSTIMAECPAVVLLDIGLPDRDGYDVCRDIKASANGHRTSILFLSGHDSLDARLKAYEAGGDDFMAKPFELKELSAKVERINAYTQEKLALIDRQSETQSLVFETMTVAAEYGEILQFFRRCLQTESAGQLAQSVFDLMNALGLRATLQLRDGDQQETFSTSGKPASPIELNLFESLTDAGRLFHFGSRTLCNGHQVSLLIKNMPLEDATRCGRYRDVLAHAIEACEDRWAQVLRQDRIARALDSIRQVTDAIHVSLTAPDARAVNTLDRLSHIINELQSAFHFLELTEDQERFFHDLIDSATQDLSALLNIVAQIVPQLAVVQKDILSALTQRPVTISTRTEHASDNKSSAELF